MSAVPRRRLISPPTLTLVPQLEPAPSSVDAFAKEKKPRKPRGISQKKFDEATARAAEMAASLDWSKARAIDFVALYASMHERVYGAAPVMSPVDRLNASFMAAAFQRTHLEDDPQRLADFLWWVWRREKERESWRRENGRDGGSISWRLQFSPRLLTDYRVAMAREASRKG